MSRPPVRSERVEQAHIIQVARTLGAAVYVLGTVRRRGDYPGTMQTPGLPDLWLMWPPARPADWWASGVQSALWWEVKRVGGTRSPAQVQFANQCEAAGVAYGWGDCDAFIRWCREHGRLRGEIGRSA